MAQKWAVKWSEELWSLASKCRASRGAHLPALPQPFISHICTSLPKQWGSVWCVAAQRNLYPAVTSTADNIFPKTTTSFERQCSLCVSGAIRGSTFSGYFSATTVGAGSLSSALMGADGGPSVWLWGEEVPWRGLCICCWCMRLASMHYSKTECSKDDVPDSCRRMDCHHEFSRPTVFLQHCSDVFPNKQRGSC